MKLKAIIEKIDSILKQAGEIEKEISDDQVCKQFYISYYSFYDANFVGIYI